MTKHRINDYANSMFRFEELHEDWLKKCTAYLIHLFGKNLEGLTVMDYAFGRGNWSLAFLRAGAARVIAVDAALDNVRRFQAYCHQHNIQQIEIINGNILEQPLNLRADFYWLYGILPVIEEIPPLLNSLTTQANANALFYVYAYNASSLREFTVVACRKLLVYEWEKEFQQDAPLFLRSSRLRARDDLTAPYVNFHTAQSLAQLLSDSGLYTMRQDADFQEFLYGEKSTDFYPHQMLCSLNPEDAQPIQEPSVPYQVELIILRQLLDLILAQGLSSSECRTLAIGLYNTHFGYLERTHAPDQFVVELFLFLIYILLQKQVFPDILPQPAQIYIQLAHAALKGEPKNRKFEISRPLGSNAITDYLVHNHIRL